MAKILLSCNHLVDGMCLFVGSLVRSLVRWFVGSFVGSFVGWLVRLLVCLFVSTIMYEPIFRKAFEDGIFIYLKLESTAPLGCLFIYCQQKNGVHYSKHYTQEDNSIF